jgi:hypothetical protein
MRHTSFVLGGLVMWAVLGLVEIAGAQPPPGPMIHRVTLQPDAGVLTITGTALGPDLLVMLEGQPVPVLPGATDTLVQVVAPDTILTTPGMYRLTMVDPVRQMGDGFVLTSPAGSVLTASDGARYRPGDGHATATTWPKPRPQERP